MASQSPSLFPRRMAWDCQCLHLRSTSVMLKTTSVRIWGGGDVSLELSCCLKIGPGTGEKSTLPGTALHWLRGQAAQPRQLLELVPCHDIRISRSTWEGEGPWDHPLCLDQVDSLNKMKAI